MHAFHMYSLYISCPWYRGCRYKFQIVEFFIFDSLYSICVGNSRYSLALFTFKGFIHPLQGKNCDRHLWFVVVEDFDGKFRLTRVKLNLLLLVGDEAVQINYNHTVPEMHTTRQFLFLIDSLLRCQSLSVMMTPTST